LPSATGEDDVTPEDHERLFVADASLVKDEVAKGGDFV
jgi:hypothetical protein